MGLGACSSVDVQKAAGVWGVTVVGGGRGRFCTHSPPPQEPQLPQLHTGCVGGWGRVTALLCAWQEGSQMLLLHCFPQVSVPLPERNRLF